MGPYPSLNGLMFHGCSVSKPPRSGSRRQTTSRKVGGAPCGVPGGGPPGCPFAPPSTAARATDPGPSSLACFPAQYPTKKAEKRRFGSVVARSNADATYRSRKPCAMPTIAASTTSSPPARASAASKSSTARRWSSSADSGAPTSHSCETPPGRIGRNIGWKPRMTATWLACVAARKATRPAYPHPTTKTAAVGGTSGAGGSVTSSPSSSSSFIIASRSSIASSSAPPPPPPPPPPPSGGSVRGRGSAVVGASSVARAAPSAAANRSKSYSSSLVSFPVDVASSVVVAGRISPSASEGLTPPSAAAGSRAAIVDLASSRLRRSSSETTSASSPTSLRIFGCDSAGCAHVDSDAYSSLSAAPRAARMPRASRDSMSTACLHMRSVAGTSSAVAPISHQRRPAAPRLSDEM